MNAELFLRAPVGLLPVLGFLVFLLYLDSYKLVRARTVLLTIAAGAALTIPSYFLNAVLLGATGMDYFDFARYVAPVLEESLKAVAVLVLFLRYRIGLLVDGAILGFAIGAGFAVAENFFYLYRAADAGLAVWLVRGCGTAMMHGGATALFAIVSQSLTERSVGFKPLLYLPGWLLAVVLHAVYNHFPLHPITMMLVVLLVLPSLLWFVFRHSARRLHEWLQLDFDADALLLEQIKSGQFDQSRAGRLLSEMRAALPGPVLVDMLCYLRLYTELAMRAKGALMMRENGFEVPVGERTRAKLEELEYLGKSIGKAGILALQPFLHIERRDLWQLHVLSGTKSR